jgi:hypothetical protein
MQNWLGEANSNSFESLKTICGPEYAWPMDMNTYMWRRPCYIDKISWERSSKKLVVSEAYKERFKEFKTYFISEMKAIGDESMQKEVDILTILAE